MNVIKAKQKSLQLVTFMLLMPLVVVVFCLPPLFAARTIDILKFCEYCVVDEQQPERRVRMNQ
ncbi:hypothetical protein T4D_14126 [Trichinella pseudospiralis]|uniref:Uncharacterized protein n=1 Tax=Trichinella pseudospiralis TaxID=6337 RepID=A0A0V1F9Y5_TRIPS|nr:hypothetical protein T4D_14126 [Trichinella pseudospiralis]